MHQDNIIETHATLKIMRANFFTVMYQEVHIWYKIEQAHTPDPLLQHLSQTRKYGKLHFFSGFFCWYAGQIHLRDGEPSEINHCQAVLPSWATTGGCSLYISQQAQEEESKT